MIDGTSHWRRYIGYAVTSIEKTTQTDLEVYCPELNPFLTGTPDDKSGKEVIPIIQITTSPVGYVRVSDTIYATYLGTLTNRSIPDVHVGERVWLINFGGTGDWYWEPMAMDDNLRTTEHVKLVIADKKQRMDRLTDDNSWFMEFDTKYNNNKRFRISTSKANGEEYKYLFQIDAKASTVTLNDDVGNEIFLDSKNTLIRLKNKAGSVVELANIDIKMSAPNNIEIVASKKIMMKAQTMEVDVANSLKVSAPTYTTNSMKYTLKSTDTTISGASLKITAAASTSITSASISISAPITSGKGVVRITGMNITTGPVQGTPVSVAIP